MFQVDARTLARQIFETEADLLPDTPSKTLTVRIHHLTQAAHDEVLGKLCVAINETQTVFPGTDLTLIFKIGSSEIPPDQESSEGVVHQSLTSAGHQCDFLLQHHEEDILCTIFGIQPYRPRRF